MSTVKANKWLHSDGTETTEVEVPSLDQRMALAWVNWDTSTTGSPVIRDSYNISSISDSGVGKADVYLATGASAADFAAAGGFTVVNYAGTMRCNVLSTTRIQVFTAQAYSNSYLDPSVASIIAFGN